MVSACGFLMRCAPTFVINTVLTPVTRTSVEFLGVARQRRLHQQRRRLFRSSSSPLICSRCAASCGRGREFEILLEIAERVVRGESPPQTVVFQMTEGSPFGFNFATPLGSAFSPLLPILAVLKGVLEARRE